MIYLLFIFQEPSIFQSKFVSFKEEYGFLYIIISAENYLSAFFYIWFQPRIKDSLLSLPSTLRLSLSTENWYFKIGNLRAPWLKPTCQRNKGQELFIRTHKKCNEGKVNFGIKRPSYVTLNYLWICNLQFLHSYKFLSKSVVKRMSSKES